jgi:hypothetical protein
MEALRSPARRVRRRFAHICVPVLSAFACVLLVAAATAPAAALEDLTLEEVRQRIVENGWSWEAGDAFASQYTAEERARMRGYAPPPGYDEELKSHLAILPVEKDLPTSFDWRTMDGITHVKNQGECGSCWAFAATAEMEAFVKIYYNKTLNLSEQQVISCNGMGAGCDGGWASAAYSVFYDHGGIHRHCMPYESTNYIPCTETEHIPLAWVTGWRHISNDVTQIKTALLDGPVCTGIEAAGEFDYYTSGCYDAPGVGWTNHLVLIIGWDDRACDNNGAWIIKNSWGTAWGLGGYGYVQYGAALIGSGVTQLYYTPPPVNVAVTSPTATTELVAGAEVPITWNITGGTPINYVDIWWSHDDYHFDEPLAVNLPNTGSFDWTVPNQATDVGKLIVFPHAGTDVGYGFSADLTILGHKVRYVSAAGSHTAPFESPATAAHTISAAVAACTGFDSVMVAAGDYLETVTVGSTVRLFGGWDAGFTGRDPGVNTTRLQGVSSALRFYAGSGDYGMVEGFLFENCQGGYYTNPVAGNHGGAIYSLNASPTIRDCVFRTNRAAPGANPGYGGAILACGGSPLLEDCQFEENVATWGAGVALLEPVAATLRRNTFLANVCSDSLGSQHGGGLYLAGGQASLEDDVMQGNAAGRGGGIYVVQAALDAAGVTLAGNRAYSGGGGLFAEEGDVDWRRGALTGNLTHTGNGGGVGAGSSQVVLVNMRAEGNAAASIGGAVYVMGGAEGRVENCLFEGNGAGSLAGGVFVSTPGAFSVRNSVVTGSAGGGLFCVGTAATADYNDVYDNGGNDYCGNPPGPHDVSGDPCYVDVAGGDYGLGLHSPCLDAGDPDPACADPDGSPADIGLLGGPEGATEAPAAVADAAIEDLGGGTYRLSWTANPEPDVVQYVVYRDSGVVFVPAVDKVVSTLTPPTVTYEDTPPHPCYYLIVAVDAEGHVGGYSERLEAGSVSGIGEDGLPRALAIAGVAPNPFNPQTTIWYDLPRRGPVNLALYDLRGRLVRTLVDGIREPGRHAAVWDGRDHAGGVAAAGVYFVRVRSGDGEVTRKVLLAK